MLSPLNSFDRLTHISRQPQRRILGLMSGTSLDGVDLALTTISTVDQKPSPQLERFLTLPYPDALKERIQTQMQPSFSSVDQICALHVDLGQFLAERVLEALNQWRVEPSHIDCIASHGQTLFHLPEGRNWQGKPLHATLQIGDADQIAAQTGILTISDFRMKDLAVGGAGAPLIPYVDFLLFCELGKHRVLHNLGGISNLTYLPDTGDSQDLIAFDTGPANVLINLAVESLIDPQMHYDAQGQIAAKGKIAKNLLEELLNHPYFAAVPPKSTGLELFGPIYLQEVLSKAESLNLLTEDLVATLTALTAYSIRNAYQNFLPRNQPIEVYFSGGGVHNQTLMQQIQSLLPHLSIHPFSDLGMNADAREAICFAVLAHELLSGRPVTLPGITGSRHITTLGKISLP